MDHSKVISAKFSDNFSIYLGVTVNGIAGDVYDCQSSTNLRDWHTFTTVTNFYSTIRFRDLDTNLVPFRAYRALAH